MIAALEIIEKVGEDDADPDNVSMLGLEDDVIDISCEAVAADVVVVGSGSGMRDFVPQSAFNSLSACAVDSWSCVGLGLLIRTLGS